jgi:hypothetical protein
VKEIGMPIDSAALARNLSSLAGLDAEHDFPRAMQQLASAAKALLRVDGAGLMLVDAEGQLRWASASGARAIRAFVIDTCARRSSSS